MKKLITSIAIGAMCAAGLGSLQAQPTIPAATATQGLVLTFQNPGGATNPNNILLASLGSVNWYRDSAQDASFTTITNINTALVGAYGANWATTSTLWSTAVAFRGVTSDITRDTLQTSDPFRTLYFGRARLGVGTIGEANSTAFITTAPFVDQAHNNGLQIRVDAGNLATNLLTTSTSVLENQLPITNTTTGLQGPAFGTIPGGIQAWFQEDAISSFGAAGNVLFGLDLYRMQTRNNIDGQYGLGEAIGVAKYLGTVTLASNGDVGFTSPIPEPSSALLLGLGFLLFLRRRRNQ